MSIFTLAFWKASGERAIKTTAQAAVSVGLVGATGILDADWVTAGSVAALAGVVSILTSIASNQVGEPGPSLTNEVTLVKGLE